MQKIVVSFSLTQQPVTLAYLLTRNVISIRRFILFIALLAFAKFLSADQGLLIEVYGDLTEYSLLYWWTKINTGGKKEALDYGAILATMRSVLTIVLGYVPLSCC